MNPPTLDRPDTMNGVSFGLVAGVSDFRLLDRPPENSFSIGSRGNNNERNDCFIIGRLIQSHEKPLSPHTDLALHEKDSGTPIHQSQN
jgi:hypothetical protein